MAKKRSDPEGTHSQARTLENLFAAVRDGGLRLTEPRRAILQVLMENHGPYSAEEIYKKITHRAPDRATVYRCVLSLVGIGLLRRCEFGDGMSRYELAGHGNSHHHHLICTECKRIEIVENEEIEQIDRFIRDLGYTNVSHTLEFFGNCPKCT